MKQKTNLKPIVLSVCFLLTGCIGVSVQAQDSAAEEKRQSIRHLLRINRAGELSVETLRLILPEMRAIYSELLNSLPADKKQRAVQIMEEELFRVFTAERMVEEMTPIYDSYFTSQEIKELIAFFESPAGRKFISVQPQILKDAGTVGERLAGEGVIEIQRRMQAEGITIPPSKIRPLPRRRPRS